jgi:hypothetical protein
MPAAASHLLWAISACDPSYREGPARVARAAMRHAPLDLAGDTCTDPSLLEVAGAVEALPRLSLRTHGVLAERLTEKAT